MNRRRDRDSKAKIAEIRDIQRRSAELDAASAAEAVRRLEAARAEQGKRLQDSQRAWAGVMTAPALRLDLAGAWSAEVLAGESALGRASAAVEEAERQCAARRDAWGKAAARSDLARDEARSAGVAARRHREEAALGELADRMTQRRQAS